MRRSTILTLGFILAACRAPGATPAPVPPAVPPAPSDVSADERAVYAAMVDQVFARRGPVVLADSAGGAPADFPGQWSGLDAATSLQLTADLQARNRTRVAMPPDLGSTAAVRLFSRGTVFTGSAANLDDSYATFRARYAPARGFWSISRPGFDAARRHAIVATGYACGGLCGDGSVVLLERTASGGWKVVTERPTWIA